LLDNDAHAVEQYRKHKIIDKQRGFDAGIFVHVEGSLLRNKSVKRFIFYMAFAYRGSLTNICHKTYGHAQLSRPKSNSRRPTLSDGLYLVQSISKKAAKAV
jgi:hypothetical protein